MTHANECAFGLSAVLICPRKSEDIAKPLDIYMPLACTWVPWASLSAKGLRCYGMQHGNKTNSIINALFVEEINNAMVLYLNMCFHYSYVARIFNLELNSIHNCYKQKSWNNQRETKPLWLQHTNKWECLCYSSLSSLKTCICYSYSEQFARE